MFRFQCGDAASPIAGAPLDSPYSLGRRGGDALGSPLVSPKRAQRKIARSPFKVRLPVGDVLLQALLAPHAQHQGPDNVHNNASQELVKLTADVCRGCASGPAEVMAKQKHGPPG